jgi:glycosyltransferase involved in cell wall biosynthesis
MATQNKPTVTIGIPAFNEAGSIESLLESIHEQRDSSFDLKEITIISDGSTDDTVARARGFDDNRITVIEHATRKGKPTRLNELSSNLETDVLVYMDADVKFENAHCLDALVTTLCESEPVALVSGALIPLPGKTFIEKAINCTFEAYQSAILQYKNGNNIYTVSGRLIAAKKKIYKEFSIPENMISDDKYMYLYTVNQGFSYRYAPQARVLFRSPQTLKDHINQNTRYVGDRPLMLKYFPAVILDKLYFFPQSILRQEMVRELRKHPLLSVSIFSVNIYCKVRARLLAETIYDSKWQEVTTSKELS